MRKANFFFGFLLFLLLSSCKNNSEEHVLTLPASNGTINHIAVIIEDALWSGEIGDTLRKKLAAPLEGLQEEEPTFTINQYSPKIFTDAVKLNRTIVVISKAAGPGFKHVENQYANPQNVFYIKGHSIPDICQTIEIHAQTLISSIKFYEIIESQRLDASRLLSDKIIQKKFGFTLQAPIGFHYAVAKKNFLWLKKDVPSGNSNLLIYSVPFSSFQKNKDLPSNIIHFRDSIEGIYVKGMTDKAKMVTEESYAPYVTSSYISNSKVTEIRGTWELENSFMNGPFITYAIKDNRKRRYLIADGFVYNPSSPKRDMLFELEAIIKSIQFLK